MHDLGTLGGQDVTAQLRTQGMNMVQVVGRSVTASGATQAVLWTVTAVLPDPVDPLDAIAAAIEAASLPTGNERGLFATLDAASQQISRGNHAAATQLVQALINQVEALVRSARLSAEPGQAIIDAAQAAIAALG